MDKKFVIGLLGGPGIGKSTNSAYLYYLLKESGINAEYVQEFAKELVYEKRLDTLQNSIYVLGKQYKKIITPFSESDMVVTDGSILISAMHKPDCLSDNFTNLIVELFNMHSNKIYLLKRTHKYQIEGRLEDEQHAIEIDRQIEQFLIQHEIPYEYALPTREGMEEIRDKILATL